MMAGGLARIRFTGDILGEALPQVPRSLRLAGSECSRDGIVILLFSSPDVPEGEVVDMVLEVHEKGIIYFTPSPFSARFA